MPPVAAVLFDLDGTLVDSAQDLAGTANDMRAARGLPALAYEALRLHGGSGARGMLGAAVGLQPGQPGFEALRVEFLDRYEARMLSQTHVFESVAPVLLALARSGLAWGIVTNKALRFAQPMVQALGLLPGAAVLIGGDSTPHTKPPPAPLLEAARRLDLQPRACAYVGDDPRDVQAGRAAGMHALAASWGYLGPGAGPHDWGADAVLAHPHALLNWLELA